MAVILKGRGAVPGVVCGEALVCPRGVTGWGGLDPQTGLITDAEAAERGQTIKGKILVIPGSSGSNGWSCYFTATHVAGNGPAALLVTDVDSSVGVALACMNIPAVVDFAAEDDPCKRLKSGDRLRVDGATGIVEVL